MRISTFSETLQPLIYKASRAVDLAEVVFAAAGPAAHTPIRRAVHPQHTPRRIPPIIAFIPPCFILRYNSFPATLEETAAVLLHFRRIFARFPPVCLWSDPLQGLVSRCFLRCRSPWLTLGQAIPPPALCFLQLLPFLKKVHVDKIQV